MYSMTNAEFLKYRMEDCSDEVKTRFDQLIEQNIKLENQLFVKLDNDNIPPNQFEVLHKLLTDKTYVQVQEAWFLYGEQEDFNPNNNHVKIYRENKKGFWYYEIRMGQYGETVFKSPKGLSLPQAKYQAITRCIDMIKQGNELWFVF